MGSKASKWIFRVSMLIIAAVLIYSIFLIYWKTYYVGK